MSLHICDIWSVFSTCIKNSISFRGDGIPQNEDNMDLDKQGVCQNMHM